MQSEDVDRRVVLQKSSQTSRERGGYVCINELVNYCALGTLPDLRLRLSNNAVMGLVA